MNVMFKKKNLNRTKPFYVKSIYISRKKTTHHHICHSFHDKYDEQIRNLNVCTLFQSFGLVLIRIVVCPVGICKLDLKSLFCFKYLNIINEFESKLVLTRVNIVNSFTSTSNQT